MLYTIAVLAHVLFFLTLGSLYYRRKVEAIQDPKKRAEYTLPLVQGIFRKILKTAHVTVEVEGMENLTSIPKDEGVLFVGNHRSYFDVIIAYTLVDRPTGFIAKAEIEKIRPLKRWMDELGCLFMDRNNLKQSLKVIITAIKQVREGQSIWIYPEVPVPKERPSSIWRRLRKAPSRWQRRPVARSYRYRWSTQEIFWRRSFRRSDRSISRCVSVRRSR